MWSINTWSGGGGEPGRRRRPVGGILWSLPWRWPLSEWQLRCLLWRAAESQNIIQVMRNWCCWSATEHRNTSPQLLTVYVCVCLLAQAKRASLHPTVWREPQRVFSATLHWHLPVRATPDARRWDGRPFSLMIKDFILFLIKILPEFNQT